MPAMPSAEVLNRVARGATCTLSHRPATPPAWKLVGQFATLESAQAVADRLCGKGVVASVSMVGGLSVIARA